MALTMVWIQVVFEPRNLLMLYINADIASYSATSRRKAEMETG